MVPTARLKLPVTHLRTETMAKEMAERLANCRSWVMGQDENERERCPQCGGPTTKQEDPVTHPEGNWCDMRACFVRDCPGERRSGKERRQR